MTIALALVPADEVLAQAHDLKPFIEKASAGSSGKFLPVDIFRVLIRGEWQLWTARDEGALRSILLTRIVLFPQMRVCEMLAAVGDSRDETMVPFLADIERWAKQTQGCRLMQPIARPGWERVFKPFGYVRTHSILEKRL